MDINFEEKKFPRLVEIVNKDNESIKAEITNFPVSSDGQTIRVNVSNSLLNLRPSSGSTFTIQLDNILLLQSGGGFFAVPLNSIFTGISQSVLNSLLASYKSAYSLLVSGVTAATLHYSKYTNGGVVTAEVYNLKDTE